MGSKLFRSGLEQFSSSLEGIISNLEEFPSRVEMFCFESRNDMRPHMDASADFGGGHTAAGLTDNPLRLATTAYRSS